MFFVNPSAPIYEWCVEKAGAYVNYIAADENRYQSLAIVGSVKSKYGI